MNEILFLRPHPAAVERTLPRDIAKARWIRSDVVGVFDRAQEMSDDLYRFPENVREESCFRAGIVDGPRYAARWAGQANISLRADSMAQQERRGSSRRRDGVGRRGARDRPAEIDFILPVLSLFLGVGDAGGGQQGERHQGFANDAARDRTAQELPTAILVHFFLLLPLI